MGKTKKNFLLVFCFLFLAFFLVPLVVTADYTYTPMENIPGFENISDFPDYLLAIYKFGIWTVGIVALFMITFGGFMYMTAAGNTSRMDSAKRVIFDAFYGLIVALAAWLILFVINPDLVKVNISLKAVQAPSTSEGGENIVSTVFLGEPWPDCCESTFPSGTISDARARSQLSSVGISVAGTKTNANCATVGELGCTSLDGIPQTAIDKIIAAKPLIGNFKIIGGTEYWLHKSHGPGKPVFDIIPSVPKSQWPDIVNKLLFQGEATTAFCDNGGRSVPCGVASHIHVKF